MSKLGDFVRVQGGYAFKSSELSDDKTGVPVIKIGNITGGSFVDLSNYQSVSFQLFEKTKSFATKDNDILIAMTGANVGKTSRVPVNSDAYLINQRVGRFLLKEDCPYTSDFIYYVVSSKQAYQYFSRVADGAAQPNISGKTIEDLEFPNIDSRCANKIGNILKSLDDKIQLNTQINQTLEQIAQTIFKSWFIDFDPVHAKANALASGQTLEQATQAAMAEISGKNTQELHRLQTANPEQYQQLWEIAEAFPSGFSGYKNLGEIPIGWNVLTFKDFISESKEKIGSLEDVPEYSVGNEGIYPRSEKYNKSLSKTPEKNKVVRIGDLVFGMGSKTLNWGIMNDEIGSVSPAYFVYRIFTNINYIYLNKYIKAKEYDFQNLIKPTSRQGQSVDKEMFLKKEIYVPNEYLLNIYLNKLKEIDSLVYSYTTEVLILEQIRDELLPKLLSGEI
ncbi:restriction endonuclease subunit S [Glaesserella parasuis]|uniref:restriction endonuclease subunit S n=1 Tax=Glaesserella parasuis TaxID=738 RepID=UPI001327CB8C|nr:restriction endonuclease subunit S [Glaesserella parasuis]MDG6237420.1 restriction endonuclease subunit S [Glaesserella parasuis]MDG6265644.1 restriction endonuclease subunit S [Glaesserella parasuis]MDP0241078.1 restriction endonuclease subunit S [Glaesserella parasuis]MDP0321618.1 restriction endonuclease subunit S [Glaesserella parasuis]MDP0323852.1 restriction endonuclease subunit S [Glaesserella parasuis]